MRKIVACIIFLILTATSFGQLPKRAMKNLGSNLYQTRNSRSMVGTKALNITNKVHGL